MNGKDILVDVLKLNNENIELANNFECGNEEIDKYLKHNALKDMEQGKSITRWIVNKNNSEIMAFYSINCSSINVKMYDKLYFYPSIEIKMFALDLKYQHMKAFEDDEDFMLSDYLLNITIKKLTNISEDIIGAEFIMLYSVPSAVSFYKRNGFELFKEFMLSSDDIYLDECSSMFFKL